MDMVTFRTEFSAEMLQKINLICLKRRRILIVPLLILVAAGTLLLLFLYLAGRPVDLILLLFSLAYCLFGFAYIFLILPGIWKNRSKKTMEKLGYRIDLSNLSERDIRTHSQTGKGEFDQRMELSAFSNVTETQDFFFLENGRVIVLILDKHSVNEEECSFARQVLQAAFPKKKYKQIRK